ncbi:hypothetical protein [Burkholderia sp. PU8-34]
MFRAYNLALPSRFKFDEWHVIGKNTLSRQKSQIDRKLQSFVMSNGTINATRMTANWFPSLKADIFISHSHEDEHLAITLTGLLNKAFGLTCFVDSCAWGYGNDLISLLDKGYCLNEKTGTYHYNTRNKTTAHVHMMLTIALTQMIDECEVVIFLNTPHSITPLDSVVGSNGTTSSPWIYCEIAMTRLIRTRSPQDHRATTMKEVIAKADSVKVAYDLNLGHLTSISIDHLIAWANASKEGEHPLDTLYTVA